MRASSKIHVEYEVLKYIMDRIDLSEIEERMCPSGDNVAEGDLWYNTSTEELLVYRQVSGGFEWHTIASAGGSSPTSFTLDGGSF